MQTPSGQEPEAADPDARTEQARLMHWQRRARTFAWACGLRVDRTAHHDED